MKTSTVDLVVTGDETAAVAAAVDAVRRGQRVLVVSRSDDARVVARLRRLCRAAKNQLTVMTNAEVVCVDGVDGVEAAVVRGESDAYIVFRELLPNLWPPTIVEGCIRLSYAVLLSVSLSYLGLAALVRF